MSRKIPMTRKRRGGGPAADKINNKLNKIYNTMDEIKAILTHGDIDTTFRTDRFHVIFNEIKTALIDVIFDDFNKLFIKKFPNPLFKPYEFIVYTNESAQINCTLTKDIVPHTQYAKLMQTIRSNQSYKSSMVPLCNRINGMIMDMDNLINQANEIFIDDKIITVTYDINIRAEDSQMNERVTNRIYKGDQRKKNVSSGELLRQPSTELSRSPSDAMTSSLSGHVVPAKWFAKGEQPARSKQPVSASVTLQGNLLNSVAKELDALPKKKYSEKSNTFLEEMNNSSNSSMWDKKFSPQIAV